MAEHKDSMKVYQAVLLGYDGSTDATDHLIKWIGAESLEDAERCCAHRGWLLKEPIHETSLAYDSAGVDFTYRRTTEPNECPLCGSPVELHTKDAFITHEYVDIPAHCTSCKEELRAVYDLTECEVD